MAGSRLISQESSGSVDIRIAALHNGKNTLVSSFGNAGVVYAESS
jgi:hypothetical protein